MLIFFSGEMLNRRLRRLRSVSLGACLHGAMTLQRGNIFQQRLKQALMPDIRDISEVIPGFEGDFFWGYLVPAGTPRPIVLKLNGAINDIRKQPGIVKRLNAATAEPASGSPEQFGKIIADNLAKWGRVAREYNITAED